MRETFFKLLPYLTGACLGWLIFFPPAAFPAPGPWRPLVMGALLIVGLLATTGLHMALGLPKDVRIERVVESPPADVEALLQQYRALGFEAVDPPLRLYLRPAAMMWVMANRQLGCWGTVFSTGTVPRRVGYDVFSIIEGDRGQLSSVADSGAAVFPLPPGHFKQVFPGAPPKHLLEYHRRSQEHLMRLGARFEAPGPVDLPERVRRSLDVQRRVIAANPLRAAAVTLWRATLKTTPYGGPVQSQKGFEKAFQKLSLVQAVSGRS
jgi:hypothetical protein